MEKEITNQPTAINLCYILIDLASKDNKKITQEHLQYFVYFAFKYHAQYNDEKFISSTMIVSTNKNPMNLTIMQEFSSFKKNNISIESYNLEKKLSNIEFYQSLILEYIWSKYGKMKLNEIAQEAINDKVFNEKSGTEITVENVKESFNDDHFLPYMDFLVVPENNRNTKKIKNQTTAINLCYMFIDLASKDKKLITQKHLQCFIYFALKYHAQYNNEKFINSKIIIAKNGNPMNITVMQEFSSFKKNDIIVDSDIFEKKITYIEFYQALILEYIWSKFYKMDLDKIVKEVINDKIFNEKPGTEITVENIKESFNDDGFLPYINFLMPSNIT